MTAAIALFTIPKSCGRLQKAATCWHTLEVTCGELIPEPLTDAMDANRDATS